MINNILYTESAVTTPELFGMLDASEKHLPPVYRMSTRIYEHDVNQYGVLQHTSILKFFERARVELLRSVGFELSAVAELGIALVTRNIDIEHYAVATIDDLVTASATVVAKTGAEKTKITNTMILKQTLYHNDTLLACANIRMLCINQATQRLIACPPTIVTALLGNQDSNNESVMLT